MTPSPRPDPTLSFRNIPPVIYVAAALGVAGSLVVLIPSLLGPATLEEWFLVIRPWHMLSAGCYVASTILLALGLIELARRRADARRELAQLGAVLGLVSLAWFGVQPLFAITQPAYETERAIFEWVHRGVGALSLLGAVLLTVGADAWRRAPAAAVALVAYGATGSWVPVLGEALSELVGQEPASMQLYSFARIAVSTAATLAVAAALAADGRAPAPEPRAAAGGLRLARGALVFRVLAAVVIAGFVLAGRSPTSAKIVAYGGPAVMALAMIALAVGVQRVAGAGLDGMPRLLLSLGAALILGWAGIQLEQITVDLAAGSNLWSPAKVMLLAQFPTAGPIAATIGLALVGSAIGAFAQRRGNDALRQTASRRTFTFVVVTLGGIGLQSLLPGAKSAGNAVSLILFGAAAAVAGILTMVGLFDQAADSLDAAPEVPTARVV